MNLRRTFTVARKEYIHILRDKRSLGMALAVPLLLLLMFGYALTLDVDRIPTLLPEVPRPVGRDEATGHRESVATAADRGWLSLLLGPEDAGPEAHFSTSASRVAR